MKFTVFANKTCVPLRNGRKHDGVPTHLICRSQVGITTSSRGETVSHPSCFPLQKKGMDSLHISTFSIKYTNRKEKNGKFLKSRPNYYKNMEGFCCPGMQTVNHTAVPLGKYGGNMDASICGRLFLSRT